MTGGSPSARISRGPPPTFDEVFSRFALNKQVCAESCRRLRKPLGNIQRTIHLGVRTTTVLHGSQETDVDFVTSTLTQGDRGLLLMCIYLAVKVVYFSVFVACTVRWMRFVVMQQKTYLFTEMSFRPCLIYFSTSDSKERVDGRLRAKRCHVYSVTHQLKIRHTFLDQRIYFWLNSHGPETLLILSEALD